MSTTPRLLDLAAAASYLSVSPWTLRALIANGELRPVRLPSTRGTSEAGRRVLLDREDLDAKVREWKARS